MIVEKAKRCQHTNFDEEYRMPMFPGTKVCLNPESPDYEELKKSINDEDLYLVNMCGAGHGRSWIEMGKVNVDNWSITLMNRNGTRYAVCYSEVLPIEGKEQDIIRFETEQGVIVYFKDNITKEQKQELLEKTIITCMIFDDKWRKKAKEKVIKDLNKIGLSFVE